MATTAAVVGGASYVGTRRANTASQEQEAQQQELDDAQQRAAYAEQQAAEARAAAAQAPPAQSPGDDPTIAQLKRFAELHDSGVLSDEEFAQAKAKLLGGL
jgi:type II secretory pathway component PulM